MKGKTLIWVGLGVLAWYLLRKSQGKPMLPGGGGGSTTPSGSSARAAAQEARELVADVVDQTTFLPDMTTDRQRYAEDQKLCK
jgi:hypothetical protein